jgi:hypothetical protein
MDNQQEQAREKNKLGQPVSKSRRPEPSASLRRQMQRDERRIASLEGSVKVHLRGNCGNDLVRYFAVRYRINTCKTMSKFSNNCTINSALCPLSLSLSSVAIGLG